MQDFLEWQSRLSLEDVFSSQEQLSYPSFIKYSSVESSTIANDEYLILTSLAHEKGRQVLCHCLGDDSKIITPAPYSLRTKINEYGGKPYWLFDNTLIFCNQADQCLYRQRFNGSEFDQPQRISARPQGGNTYMYSDVHYLGDDLFLAIVEYHEVAKGGAENTCFIAVLDAALPDQAPRPLVTGADFYSNLVASTDQSIAWVEWNHPAMPWDDNKLCVAQFDRASQTIDNIQQVHARHELNGASHCQLAFSEDDVLYFSVDFADASGADNYWNIYAYQANRISVVDGADQITKQHQEFGYPHWQYGDSRIVCLENGDMLAIGSDAKGDQLYLIKADSSECSLVYDNQSTLQHLCSDGAGNAMALETGMQSRQSLLKFNLHNGALKKTIIRRSKPYHLPVSTALEVTYPCRDGGKAHGFYYPPVNHDGEQAASDVKPPLLVMVHGGPTARAYGHFDIQKQFWCANGFAVFDVNHRGSSGYGREYRDALYGLWGERDTADIVDGIHWLVAEGLADTARVCIRGKSAGGYAVLRALTEYPDIFKAGACYYGIGNLATLAEITHKFEKYYTDRLINEAYEAANAKRNSSQYFLRSPINKIDQIKSAMIIFQGTEDKVVPPSVAHEVVQQLAAKHIPHDYIEYPEEGHGFRQVKNNIDAWSRELNFYRNTINQ